MLCFNHCHGVVAVSSENREITNEDVTRVIEAAQVVSIPPEREIIDVYSKTIYCGWKR